ncbi:MAG: 2-C-methyl-D-erythritol 4-phosphate cytidylyltransferase [bacterium]|nr:2-C-methyl-D-erythritol 4-phosphate cytidylyltransferase [bacterium]
MPAIHIVVLSGGVGARMGAGRPKQFLPLAGRPVLVHSLAIFSGFEPASPICLVAPATYIEETRSIVQAAGFQAALRLVPGGADRHASTLAGWESVQACEPAPADEDLLLIHDAARPLVERAEIQRLVQAFEDDPALEIASLAAPISETIVAAEALPGPMARSVDRSKFFAIKTPQAVRIGCLRRMMAMRSGAEGDGSGGYTDLLTWGEAHGVSGRLVPAGPRNLKLTHPADLVWFESLLDAPADE